MKFIAEIEITGDIEEDEMTSEQKVELFKSVIKDGAESVCLYATFGTVGVLE